MPLPVQLKAVVDEMETGADDWQAYINRKTGELASFGGDTRRAVEDDDPPGEGWELDAWHECKRVLDDPDFIELPDQRDIHEYSIMERFCQSLEDASKADRLLDAIRGRGAFRRFKDMVHKLGIEDDWYRYRDEALKQVAADFLEENDIPYVDDAAAT
jgi:Uncharacterised protein family (UPF0158)